MALSIHHPTDRPNFSRVEIGDKTLYFSYSTLIAFATRGVLTVSENKWSTTTGKHLNYIDGGFKQGRLDRDLFEQKAREAGLPL